MKEKYEIEEVGNASGRPWRVCWLGDDGLWREQWFASRADAAEWVAAREAMESQVGQKS